jgi:quercetin dioxygenase-like cupin family protein
MDASVRGEDGVDPDCAGAVNLAAIARDAAGRGPAWTLRSEDLDVNLLVFASGEGVAEHVNEEVDVLIVSIAGEGIVTINERLHPLGTGQVVLVPKGTRRSTRAVGESFAYLTCHRRRAGLWPARATR